MDLLKLHTGRIEKNVVVYWYCGLPKSEGDKQNSENWNMQTQFGCKYFHSAKYVRYYQKAIENITKLELKL